MKRARSRVRTRRQKSLGTSSNQSLFQSRTVIYLVLGGLSIYQLGLTLYQVGKSISYQAKLAQLNQEYQQLTREKTDLAVKLSTQTNLQLAQSQARTKGFVKIDQPDVIGHTSPVALRP